MRGVNYTVTSHYSEIVCIGACTLGYPCIPLGCLGYPGTPPGCFGHARVGRHPGVGGMARFTATSFGILTTYQLSLKGVSTFMCPVFVPGVLHPLRGK